MKNKRLLSFISAIISFVLAALYVFAAILFAVRFAAVLDFNNQTFKDAFGFDLIKATGLNTFIAVTGILLSVALCLFKVLTGYYYIKVSGGDKLFFMQREKGVIGFSALALVVLIAFIVAAATIESLKPYIAVIITFCVLYALQIILPIAEIIAFEVKDKKERASLREVPAPTELSIKNELESDAAETKKQT